MSKLATNIWYGRFHHAEDVHSPHFLPILGWTAFLLLLAVLRLHLPFVSMPPAEIHTQILYSLTAGQTWGRQALVSSFEYPLLPTLALFFAQSIGNLIHFPATQVLVAIAQVWGLFYLLRIPKGWLARIYTGVVLALVLIVNQEAREIFYRVDPNWVAIIPAACGGYHFVLWCRHSSLRDLVLLGVNAGILVFAGISGFMLGVILLLLASCRIWIWKRGSGIPPAEIKGLHLLLWSPALYTLTLVFLANWLIMQNAVFFLRRYYNALRAIEAHMFINDLMANVGGISWLSLGALGIFALRLNQRKWRTIVLALGASLALLVLALGVLTAMKIYTPGGQILILLLALCGITLPFWDILREKLVSAQFIMEIAIITLLIVAGTIIPRPGIQSLCLATPNAPTRLDILAAVDRYTPETRIMTYGFRVPALFPDTEEERFIPRVDFNIEDLRWLAAKEDFLYALIPPADGTFYSDTSELADIHKKGRPWLIIEATWPGGWQLWRALTPADDKE